MNTVNYNDAEQLFGAVGASLKKHTAEIADIVNVYGSKNLLDIDDFTLNKSTARTKSLTTVDFGENIPKKQVIISFKVSNSNLTKMGAFRAYGPLNNNVRPLIGEVEFKDNGDYHFSFDATNLDQLYIFINNEDDASATCKISNIMLRLASIEDDTWVPYVPTNKELMSCKLNGYVGAKNLLPYPYYNTTMTESGLTITDNGDGTVKVNGTATAVVRFRCTPTSNTWPNNPILKKGIPYILTGCAEGAGNSQSAIYSITLYNSSDQVIGRDYGDGFVYIPSADEKLNSISIVIWTGAVCNNIVFKPMLRIALDSDSTYQPYAKTNKELTDDIASLAARIKAIEDTKHLTWG